MPVLAGLAGVSDDWDYPVPWRYRLYITPKTHFVYHNDIPTSGGNLKKRKVFKG